MTIHQIKSLLIFSILCTWLLAPLAFSQAESNNSQNPDTYRDTAKAYWKGGNYKKAIENLELALKLETRAKEKKEIFDDLEDVKKDYYIELINQVKQVAEEQDRSEMIRLLIVARMLEINEEEARQSGGLFSRTRTKNLKEAANLAVKYRNNLMQMMQNEATAASEEKQYPTVLRVLEQALELDPQAYESRNLESLHRKARFELERGEQLAEEGWRLLQKKQHGAALEKFNQAEEAYPGQARVREGLKQEAADRAEYTRQIKLADRAHEQNDYDTEDSHLRAAKSVYPDPSNIYAGAEKHLQDRIDRVNQRKSTLRLAREAFEDQRWDEALANYQEVLTADSNNTEATDRIPNIESQLFLATARDHLDNSRFLQFEEALSKSLEKDPDNSEAVKLKGQLANYERQVSQAKALVRDQDVEKCEQSKLLFRQAQNIFPEKFKNDRYSRYLARECEKPNPLDPYLSDIQRGLRTLLEFKPLEAIPIFENVLEQLGTDEIHLLAYLGVCYVTAYQLLEEPSKSDLDLMINAENYFRKVLRINPDYELSERLFSPEVKKIFQEVRWEGS